MTRLVKGGAAARSGKVFVGDKIVGVDGRPVPPSHKLSLLPGTKESAREGSRLPEGSRLCAMACSAQQLEE